MVDDLLLRAKALELRDRLDRVRLALPASASELRADRDAQDLVAFNMILAVQLCTDMAAHVVSDAGWRVPAHAGDLYQTLAEHNVISSELAASMRAANGLRNVVAHRYGQVDFDILYQAARERLRDLVALSDVLLRWKGP